VGNGIGFKKSWDAFIPLVGLDGNMLLDQRARLGGCQTLLAVACAQWC